jgi:TRAP-type C4-dicarboxylate transport system permease small subunit
MKPFSVLISTVAIGLIAFGCWGVFTKAGHQKYEEMAGMFPFFALAAGIILLVIVLVVTLVDIIRRKRKNKTN